MAPAHPQFPYAINCMFQASAVLHVERARVRVAAVSDCLGSGVGQSQLSVPLRTALVSDAQVWQSVTVQHISWHLQGAMPWTEAR